MANPWDNDPIVVPARVPGAQPMPWDDDPIVIDEPAAAHAHQPESIMGRVLDFFAGPAPLRGNTVAERQQDYQSRPAALRAFLGSGQAVNSVVRGMQQLTDEVTPESELAAQDLNKVLAGDIPTIGGRVATDLAMLFAPGGAVSKLPRLAGRVGGGAALNAAFGGLQAVDEPGRRGWNAAIGGVLGGAGEAAGTAVRALGARVTPEISAMYSRAKELGIDVLPSQLTDSAFVNRLQGMLRNVPFNGAKEALENQQAQFTRAAGRLIGAEGDKLTPDVFAAARQKIGGEFERLTAQNQLTLEDALLGRLGDIEKEAIDFGEEGTIKAVKNMIERVMEQSTGDSLPGRAYQSIDSQIGKLTAAGGEKGYFLSQVREALRDAMDDSIMPATRDAWNTARSQWRDMKTLEPLVAKAEGGIISPAQLMGRVTADRAGRASMAQGTRGDLGELARLGQRLKPPQTSGSAENIFAGGVLNPVNWPGMLSGVLVGRTAGGALNSPRLADVLVNGEARPAIANALAKLPSPLATALASAIRGRPIPVEPDPTRANNGR